MKPSTTLALVPIALCISLTSCETLPPGSGGEYGMTVEQPRKERFGYQGTENPGGRANPNTNRSDNPNITRRDPENPNNIQNSGTDPNGIVKPKVDPEVDPDPVEPIVETPEPVKPVTKDHPMAELVPGKSGVVFSPYVSGKKVSIEGFKPGDLAECPWSGKPFRVP